MADDRRHGGATLARLRDDIDHGRTGDKVAHSDPAVAALGTDEEAAGTPLSAADAVRVRERELQLRRSLDKPPQPQSRWAVWLAAGGAAALILVAVALVAFLRT